MLFAFDAERKAILLVGGDKSGDWVGWYKRNIPVADARFDEHQAALKDEESAGQRPAGPSGRSKERGGHDIEGVGEEGPERSRR